MKWLQQVTRVFTLVDPADTWVVLQLREDKISTIKKGAVLKGIVPGLSNKEFSFKVTYIAAMAEFATWKATNQKGDFDLRTF